MAKESIKARERKRSRLIEQYAEKRATLKADKNWEALDKLPRNSSKVRHKNRCMISGRPKGYIRFFGVSRNMFRQLALNGKIPGVKKASW